MDLVFNRHTRIARFAHGQDVYMLLDAQLIKLTRERIAIFLLQMKPTVKYMIF